MLRPLVYLIGAGPGAPDLITARGLACMQAADVVVYDHLVHPRLLRQAQRHAERIDVGSAAPQSVDQDAICYLLAEKAREGKVVARLKWGDPFVFDQGGPEALFLHEQRIPFEVVPGVPAAIGAPTYAGIPVTYPGGGDTLTFVRGHENGGRAEPRVDWTSLAKLDGTIVCYAGPRQLPKMIDALIAHGREPMEGAAIVLNGTLPDQQTFTGTLGELADAFRERTLSRPAVLVVGKVVGLRDHLRWFDERPLFGKRVLVTRSREQSGELIELLEAAGAEPVEVPLIRIAPAEDLAPLDEACAAAGTYDWIVFTSANGVEAFMGRLLESGRDARALAGARVCAVGPGTASRMNRYGIRVDLMPHDHHGEAIVKALAADGPLRGTRVLLPKADIAREVVAEQLRCTRSGRHRGHRLSHDGRRVGTGTGHLRPAARRPHRRGDLHQRLGDPQLPGAVRYRAGRRPPQPDGRGDDRPGDGGDGHPARHHAGRHPVDVFHPGAGRGARRALPRTGRGGGSVTVNTTTASSLHLARRPRRLRRTPAIRAMVRETRLSAEQFIYPLFACEGSGVRTPVGSMPGVFQLSVDQVVEEAGAALAEGVPGGAAVRPAAGQGRHRQPGLRRERAGPGRRARVEEGASGAGRDHRRVPVRVHRRTATAASCTARRSSTTPPSSSWCGPRCRTPRPAPTSWRLRT